MLFKRFSAPKAKIELKLDEVAYEYTDKLTGKIVLDPDEEIRADEIRLEFTGSQSTKWKKGLRGSTSSGAKMEPKTINVGGSVTIQKGEHYEVPFSVDIPLFSKSDPFIEIEVKVKGVVATKGRPDLTHEVKPLINFPYIINCLKQYGGCGFTTPPLVEPKICPRCGNSLKEIWNLKYKDDVENQARQALRS